MFVLRASPNAARYTASLPSEIQAQTPLRARKIGEPIIGVDGLSAPVAFPPNNFLTHGPTKRYRAGFAEPSDL